MASEVASANLANRAVHAVPWLKPAPTPTGAAEGLAAFRDGHGLTGGALPSANVWLGRSTTACSFLVAAGGLGAVLGSRRLRRKTTPSTKVTVAAAATQVSTKRRPIVQGTVAPGLYVPEHIIRPPYIEEPELVKGWWNRRLEAKTPEGVAAMRHVGKIARETLDLAAALVAPGRTTEQMEEELHTFMCDNGAYPSDLGYKGFPKSAMISVNEVICHGMPDDRPMEPGDLINVDVTLYKGGFHADTARTWVCGGETDPLGERLVAATQEALDSAVSVCRAGAPFKLIGGAVCDVAEREGFGVVRTLVGHGIGEFFHGVPQVFHCRNSDNRKMLEGTTFTIEPVLTEGSPEWRTWDDGWTNVTVDGGRAAQFEHTLLITEGGCEVLT